MVLAGRVFAKFPTTYDVRSRDTCIDEEINRSIRCNVFNQRRGIMKLCRLTQAARQNGVGAFFVRPVIVIVLVSAWPGAV